METLYGTQNCKLHLSVFTLKIVSTIFREKTTIIFKYLSGNQQNHHQHMFKQKQMVTWL